MRRCSRSGLSLFLLALVAAQSATAFEYPLSSEAIREAYFLARENSDRQTEFLERYKHNLPAPKTGPDVALVELRTPFTLVAEKIGQTNTSYHAQDAEKDFQGKTGRFGVHVEIYFTATYPKPTDTAQSLGDFWNDLKVRLKQGSEISPLKTTGRPIFSDQTISGYMGAMIDADYDAAKIDRGAPATIEVDTPDGQDVETTFDLTQLR